MRNRSRSLSALTLACAGRAGGSDLVRHNVFFADYADEFDAIFRLGAPAGEPTVYLWRRIAATGPMPRRATNACSGSSTRCRLPATKAAPITRKSSYAAKKATAVMESCGLTIEPAGPETITGPTEFNEAFPGSGARSTGRRRTAGGPRSSGRVADAHSRPLPGGAARIRAGVPIAAIRTTGGAGADGGPCFARPVPPGGYAWWYVDALSDDRQFGLTIIVFVGSVFSPYYAWARRGGRRADPQDHCAFNIACLRRGARAGP